MSLFFSCPHPVWTRPLQPLISTISGITVDNSVDNFEVNVGDNVRDDFGSNFAVNLGDNLRDNSVDNLGDSFKVADNFKKNSGEIR